ncbi:MAG: ABC transporter permease [Candidatus Aminicenantes bacterium]|nr:ABC transporter permease [Candidatus Aminicenantes bacterium]MCK5004548.1 ABC transporter permease [Candidatus Aminicenantes bacterium]
MSLVKLGLRNIFRFKKRTLITLSSVSIGLALLIIGITFMNGIDKQSLSNIINSQTSHLKIFRNGYYENKDEFPSDKIIGECEQLIKKIRKLDSVSGAERRIMFPGSLIKGSDEFPCIGVGIEPEFDPFVFNIKESLIEGDWLGKDEYDILIGKSLAGDLGLGVGDIVTARVITSRVDNQFTWNAVDFEIIGIFDTSNPNVNSGYVFLPLASAQETMSLDSGVTEIVVRLNSDEEKKILELKEIIQNEIKSSAYDYKVFSWDQLAGNFLAISKMKTKNTSMLIMIMLFIASMGIINTMLMAVHERTREIGMMMAMGMKKSEIKKVFLFEGGFIGVLGSLLGCIIGGLGSWYFEVYGMSMRSFGDTYTEIVAAIYPVKDTFYADLTFEPLFYTFLLGTIISVVATYYPASKAAKMDPVEALRHF